MMVMSYIGLKDYQKAMVISKRCAPMRTTWGEPDEVKVSRPVLKTSSLWRHRDLSLTL
jgi:hypothetical protein